MISQTKKAAQVMSTKSSFSEESFMTRIINCCGICQKTLPGIEKFTEDSDQEVNFRHSVPALFSHTTKQTFVANVSINWKCRTNLVKLTVSQTIDLSSVVLFNSFQKFETRNWDFQKKMVVTRWFKLTFWSNLSIIFWLEYSKHWFQSTAMT